VRRFRIQAGIWQWNIFWRSPSGAACFITKLDIVDETVNVTKCIGIGAYCRNAWCYQHSCYSSVRSLWKTTVNHVIVLNWSTNWKCQNNTRTMTLPAQSQDMNPIENLWHKVTLETRGDMSWDMIQSSASWSSRSRSPEPWSHLRPARQPVHSIQTESDYAQGLSQNILVRQKKVKVLFGRSLHHREEL